MGSKEKVLPCPREPAAVGSDAAPTVSGMPEGGRPRASARASDGGNGGVRGQPAAPPLPAFLRQIRRLGEHAWLARTAAAVEMNEMWAGLGYYRRARFLLEFVQSTFRNVVSDEFLFQKKGSQLNSHLTNCWLYAAVFLQHRHLASLLSVACL
uniref:Uncharacterized protein n=1 Tax=Setaria italica TaxID=4555 RepID=K3XSW0_SETIT